MFRLFGNFILRMCIKRKYFRVFSQWTIRIELADTKLEQKIEQKIKKVFIYR